MELQSNPDPSSNALTLREVIALPFLSLFAWWGADTKEGGNTKTARYAHQMGTRAPNPWGLSDMHGNEREWCADWYAEKLPGGTNPNGPVSGQARVLRGGSWNDGSGGLRSAYRNYCSPDLKNGDFGFRVVCSAFLESTQPKAPSQLPDGTAAGDRKVIHLDDVDYAFRWCPPGSFKMGSPTPGKVNDQVNVTLTQGFWMFETEVTQAMWTAVMSTSPWQERQYVRDGATFPVTYVSWDDSTAFCTKLTEVARQDGVILADQNVSLPTEAQWEYACRAGTKTEYFFGNDAAKLGDYAWHDDNAWKIDEKYAHEVGQKQPNPWGLRDMHGNASEWCGDWHTSKLRAGTNPRGPTWGAGRVCRGGSFGTSSINTRVGSRSQGDPTNTVNPIGFRVVVSVE